MRRLVVAIMALSALQIPAASAQSPVGAQGDTGRRAGIIPPGLGSLRRDDIAITVQVEGLTIRAIPLDEEVIRTLAPDAYTSLRNLGASKAPAIERIRTRLGLTSVQAWQVTLFNVQPGEARFDPRGMQIRSAGRDFRPLDVVGITPGYDEGRLAQSRSVSAIFVFDPAIQLTQPLVVTLAGVQNHDWSDGNIMSKLESERAAVWSRSAAARKPTNPAGPPSW
jgi:hypothetical protein